MNSLRFRIGLLLLLVLAASSAALISVAWYSAQETANAAHDQLLAAGAAQIAENLSVQGGVVALDPPVAVLASLTGHDDQAFYQVVDARGVLVAGAPDLTAQATDIQLAAGTIFRDAKRDGTRVRLAIVGRRMPDGWVRVGLAVTRHARAQLVRSLVERAVLLSLLMSVLALAATAFAVRQALRPLDRLEQLLRARSPNDLTPLQVHAPRELSALLAALNAFMAALDERMRRLSRVIGEAAHQIRTPITALAAQVDLLQAETQEVRRQQQMTRIQDRTQSLGRIVNQLLDHAMVIHRANATLPQRFDVVTLVRRVMLDVVPPTRIQELALDAPDTPVLAEGDPVSLREAVANLVDNAFRHGARTRMEIRITQDAAHTTIEVADDGPGIPPGDWHLVREPFHGRRDDRAGAGLGLSIVTEAMRAHGGEMVFSPPAAAGFAVVLRLRTPAPTAATPEQHAAPSPAAAQADRDSAGSGLTDALQVGQDTEGTGQSTPTVQRLLEPGCALPGPVPRGL